MEINISREFCVTPGGRYIVDDLMKLVRKNTKIQAAPGFHDDSIMSYLFCLYVDEPSIIGEIKKECKAEVSF